MDRQKDRLDEILAGYERDLQEETRVQVQRALRLEDERRKGAEALRNFVVQPARDVAERLQDSGHEVIYQEHLDHYPPNVRLHLWPQRAALEMGETRRRSLEFTWGVPNPDSLCVGEWRGGTGGRRKHRASAPPHPLDQLWVREQLLEFVREALEDD